MPRDIFGYANDAVRAIRLARKVFKRPLLAMNWLNTPNEQLGNKAPAELLFDDAGAASVIFELKKLLREQKEQEADKEN